MGLDMYLTKKTYIGNNHKKALGEKETPIRIPGIKQSQVTYITEEIGYWRKANAIHKWFVDNVQNGVDNCAEHYVSKEKLEQLLELVTQTLENRDAKNLPTQAGFFFGSTEIDEYYWKDLESTKKILENALKEEDKSYIYYQSSW